MQGQKETAHRDRISADTTGICLARGISDFTTSLRFSSTYTFPRFRCLGPLPCASADLCLRPLTYRTTFLSTSALNPCSYAALHTHSI